MPRSGETRTVTREIKNLGLGPPTFRVDEKQVCFKGQWVPASSVQKVPEGCPLGCAVSAFSPATLGIIVEATFHGIREEIALRHPRSKPANPADAARR